MKNLKNLTDLFSDRETDEPNDIDRYEYLREKRIDDALTDGAEKQEAKE